MVVINTVPKNILNHEKYDCYAAFKTRFNKVSFQVQLTYLKNYTYFILNRFQNTMFILYN